MIFCVVHFYKDLFYKAEADKMLPATLQSPFAVQSSANLTVRAQAQF